MQILIDGKPKIDVELDASDIQIGAVELKDATTATRLAINAANTARTTGTVVLPSQHIGANGSPMPSGVSAADPIHVSTSGAIPTTIDDGRQVTAGSPVAIALAGSTAIKEVTVTAELNNTDIIVVGGSSVVATLASRTGTPLHPGDSVTLEADNLAEVYINAMVGTEGCTYTYLA